MMVAERPVMGGKRMFRRTRTQNDAVPGEADPTDPYVAYLVWIAAGRPGSPRGGAAASEVGTKSVFDHVQMLDRGPDAAPAPVAAQAARPEGGSPARSTADPSPRVAMLLTWVRSLRSRGR
jgi:hypothetical protein